MADLPAGIVLHHTVNLGEDQRTLQCETVVPFDTPLAQINAVCDTMRQVSDRQRAIHLLPSYKRNLEDAEYKSSEKQKEVEEIRRQIQEFSDETEARRQRISAQRDAALSKAQAEHYETERRVIFKPKPTMTRVEDGELSVLDESERRFMDEARGKIMTLEGQLKIEGREIYMWKKLIEEHEALAADAPAR